MNHFKKIILICLAAFNLFAVNIQTDVQSLETNASSIEQSAKVFGYNIFNGSFSTNNQHRYNPNYLINIGDVINIKLWGAFDFNASISVDSQGNVFLPKVGTIHLLGVRNDALSKTLQDSIKSVFKTNVYVYADLGNYQPVSVFVTGAVNKPGLYEGLSSDSIVQFLDKAKGIEPQYGSYRKIKILRENSVIKDVDLYSFLLNGKLDVFQFQTGDVINVSTIDNYIEINGDVKRPYRFEMMTPYVTLKDILKVSLPNPTATNFTITKWNQENQQNVSLYAIKGNDDFKIYGGEVINFLPDHNAQSIEVRVGGEHLNLHNLVVKNGTSLKEVFDKIQPSTLSDMNSFQLFRKSVAEEQRKLLNSQLDDLEAKTLTTGSMTSEESLIRKQESALVLGFIERARKIEFKGQVVINKDTNLSNVLLEDGDEIYIPKKSNMVIVQGEVMLPGAQSYVTGMSFEDYINSCGGFNYRADESGVLVIQKNGKVIKYDSTATFSEPYHVKPGDSILVLGKVETKYLQVVKDITQIVYQIAVGAAIVLRY